MNCQTNWKNVLPAYSPVLANQVIILEAEAGQTRHDILQQWLNQAEGLETTTYLISCDRREEGPWAGINALLRHIFPKIQSIAPDLLVRYDFEWVSVLPNLRQTLPVRHLSLVDEPPPNEPHLTFYPPEHTLRVAQGVINLLSAYHERLGNSNWIIVADYYDQSNSLARYFFAELMRRRGQQMNLTLLLMTEVGMSQTAISQFLNQTIKHFIKLDFPTGSTLPANNLNWTTSALELKVPANEEIEQERSLPRVIHALQQSDNLEQALEHQIEVCALYTRRGFYEDAIEYGEMALEQIEHHPVNQHKRWRILKNLHDCYLATKQSELAKQRIETAIASLNNPEYLSHAYRNLAMLYTRYHSDKNFTTAETYLQQGLNEIIRADLSNPNKFYQLLLNDRGLALVRYVQGRLTEAIEISLALYHRTYNKGSNKHLPHQALVLSNISRVYAVLQNYEEAIRYISDAITIDPHFSDYYDHRANLYFKMGDLDSAIDNYLKAIEVSPPYTDPWTNLGQCYRLKGSLVEAVDAYSMSLDLNPNQTLALIGRAQVLEMLNQSDEALIDYSAALLLDPQQPLILANRAVLYYESERYQEALDDLNRAITLAPENYDLYQNRAIVLVDLKRCEDARCDLITYLRLNLDANDRSEIEDRLMSLQKES